MRVDRAHDVPAAVQVENRAVSGGVGRGDPFRLDAARADGFALDLSGAGQIYEKPLEDGAHLLGSLGAGIRERLPRLIRLLQLCACHRSFSSFGLAWGNRSRDGGEYPARAPSLIPAVRSWQGRRVPAVSVFCVRAT